MQLRKEKGCTQESLAEIIGVSKQTISNIETGKKEASFDIMKRLKEYFKCSYDMLIDGKEKMPNDNLEVYDNLRDTTNIILGTDKQNIVCAKSSFSGNIAVYGGPRSGKTQQFIIPYITQCIRRGESFIVSDLKGEIYKTIFRLIRNNRYDIKILNDQNDYEKLKNINSLRRKKSAMFITDSGKEFIESFLRDFLKNMERTTAGQIPINIVLDEFQNIVISSDTEEKITKCTDINGINVVMVFQSFEQLNNKDGETTIDNCPIQLFFGKGDKTTTEHVKKFMLNKIKSGSYYNIENVEQNQIIAFIGETDILKLEKITEICV